ncbi:MAG: YCF48-related protein [Ignavibacteria bacterium]|nr:YCF48-related protein [Ignavibacteria bacterium]
MQPNPAQNYIFQIYAIDSNIVYAAGYFTILKTTNGGENWIGIMTGTYGSGLPTFEGLFFINALTGWLCGSQQGRKTTNGGINFDSFYVGVDLSDMYFRNELEGVSSGPYVIRKTTDGGANWNPVYLPWQWQQQFNRISFFDNQTGYVVGSSGITLRTTDFGNSWDSIGRIITPEIIYGSIFTSHNIGYAGGSFGILFKTTNGGLTWGFQDTNTLGRGYISSFWGYNDTVLRAVGGGGKIIYTTNGGKWLVGINNINEVVPETFTLHQNYPNPFNNSTIINFSINKCIV